MKVAAGFLFACLLLAPRGWSQDTPKVEFFGGASFAREDVTDVKTINGVGWHGALTGNANRWIGAVFDFSGQFSSPKFSPADLAKLGALSFETIPVNSSTFTYMGGPRVSFRKLEHVTPFIEGLFGAATLRFSSEAVGLTDVVTATSFATALGGGVDVPLTRHFAVRLFEADYLLTRFRELRFDPITAQPTFTGPRRTQNNARVSAGIIVTFGRQ
jgi:hypothetical protein